MAEFIDTHAHLDDPKFADDLPGVLARAQAVGVVKIVAVATSASSSHASLALARLHPGRLHATAGIHPNHVAQEKPEAWDEVAALAALPEVVGIGETGLDRHWNDTPFAQQEESFARHLDLSRRTGKPIIIHCREAEADMIPALRADYERHGPLHGVMHSFVGDAAFGAACLEMGLHLSFAGMLTYKNASDLRSTAVKLPLERLLVETDSPYLAPVPVRGKRNEPANVVHTAACLAGLLGVSLAVLAERTTENARRVFGI